MRVRIAILFAVVIAGWLWRDARAQVGDPIVSGAHRFQKVADGIYYATSSGTMNVGANSPILVNDNEALVVDSEITPAAARALVAERALVRALEADCHTPVGAHAEVLGSHALRLRAFVGAADGSAWVRDELDGADPERLGAAVAQRLLSAGAREVLAL